MLRLFFFLGGGGGGVVKYVPKNFEAPCLLQTPMFARITVDMHAIMSVQDRRLLTHDL